MFSTSSTSLATYGPLEDGNFECSSLNVVLLEPSRLKRLDLLLLKVVQFVNCWPEKALWIGF